MGSAPGLLGGLAGGLAGGSAPGGALGGAAGDVDGAVTAARAAAALAATGLAPLLAAMAWGRDRGIRSLEGALHVGGAALWGGLLSVAPLVRPAWAEAVAGVRLLPGGWTAPWGLADAPFVALVLAALVALWAAVRREGGVERALVWTALLVLGAAAADAAHLRQAWLAAAGLVGLLTVVEVSYALAFRDDLTGLPARRALRAHLAEVAAPFAVAMVDVDHFKRFNDRHGHDVGDQVLRMVAARLARVGGGGRAYRYGGEEFTIVFAGLDAAAAEPHLEVVRAAVAEARFGVRRRVRPATRARG
ncbi:MAG: GGDEF domain-containing protein, partial [Gemmatimonadetes bacterium]